MAKDDPYFRLRIPENLKKRIEEAAETSHRSATAEILSRLDRSFDVPGRRGALDEIATGFAERLVTEPYVSQSDIDRLWAEYERLKGVEAAGLRAFLELTSEIIRKARTPPEGG